MSTFVLAPGRKPYERRKSSAFDVVFFQTELQNIQLAVHPDAGGVSIPLTSDLVIALTKAQTKPFDFGFVEVVQDEVGGWVPTWTNASGTNGAVATPSLVANTPTLYLAVFVHDTWVMSVVASNYGNAVVDAAIEAAFTRLDDAMLPLPRTQTVVDDYIAAFS